MLAPRARLPSCRVPPSGPFTTAAPTPAQTAACVPAMASNLPFGDGVCDRRFQRLTCPRQHPELGARRLDRRRYPAGYTETSMKETEDVFRFPVAFRPPALASWASCARPRISSPYGRLTPPNPMAGTGRGFHVPHE